MYRASCFVAPRYHECMSMECHPVALTRTKCREVLEGFMGLKTVPKISSALQALSEGPTKSYLVKLNENQVKKLRNDASVKSPDNTYQLRQSIVETLDIGEEELKEKMYLYEGDVYKPCWVREDSYPLGCEMVGAVGTAGLFEVCQSLEQVLSQLLSTRGSVSAGAVTMEETGYDQCMQMNASLKFTERIPDVDDNDDYIEPNEITVAYIGRAADNNKTVVFTILLDHVAQALFTIDNPRNLWLNDVKFYENLRDENNSKDDDKDGDSQEVPVFKVPSVYPLSWNHDISFWESAEQPWDEQMFHDVIRDVAGDVIQRVELLDTYKDVTSTVLSRCCRGTYQSLHSALSYGTSHAYQNAVRLKVAEIMKVNLR